MASAAAPAHFICPITRDVMKDPVIDNEGVSYEKEAIITWLAQGNTTSPSTGNSLAEADLRPNLTLREAIEKHNRHDYTEECSGGSPTNEKSPEATMDDVNDKDESAFEEDPGKPSSLQQHEPVKIGLETHFDGKNLMVTLKPPEGINTNSSNICCVVDVSGSMEEEAVIQNEKGERESFGLSVLDVVKHALKTIISSLSPQDKFSLVTFSNDAEVIMEPTFMTAVNSQTALEKAEALCTLGSTNLWAGLQTGLNLMDQHNAQEDNTALFLLTDGQPNNSPGEGEVKALQTYSDTFAKGLPCIINTFGFGYSMDSDMLVSLSSIGNGAYSFIPDSSFVGTVFVNAVANHLTTIASGLFLDITANNNVKILTGSHSVYGGKILPRETQIIIGTIQYDQTKNIVFPVQTSKNAKVEVTLKYCAGGKTLKVECEETFDRVCAAAEAKDIKYHTARLDLVKSIDTALKDASIQYNGGYFNVKSLDKGKKVIEKSAKNLKGKIDMEERSTDLLKDLTGQLTEAFSKNDFMRKWGVHYCRSIRAAHLYQVCNNFKDPGVQHYTGQLFEQTRDKLDEIFIKLPAPKPSLERSECDGNAGPINMQRFMNLAGGCIHGDCLVHLEGREFVAISALKKGEKLLTGTGLIDTVECLLENRTDDENTVEMVRYDNNLLITPWHPIKNEVSQKWEFPANSGHEKVFVEADAVYSVLLKNRGTMIVNDIECATLAHGLTGDVIGHKFLGTEGVANDMIAIDGFKEGRIVITSDAFQRDEITGEISGICE